MVKKIKIKMTKYFVFPSGEFVVFVPSVPSNSGQCTDVLRPETTTFPRTYMTTWEGRDPGDRHPSRLRPS